MVALTFSQPMLFVLRERGKAKHETPRGLHLYAEASVRSFPPQEGVYMTSQYPWLGLYENKRRVGLRVGLSRSPKGNLLLGNA